MCEAGGAPVGWPAGHITVFEGPLPPVQSAAVATALVQWERAAHFSVAYTSDPGSADVSVTSATLTSAEPGYTEDGYTTVSYRCAPRCVYYHAAVVLSSGASLTARGWTATVLHELGHVAGLNHVGRQGEVMYPYLTDVPPVSYTDGDRAGFAALAAQRAR
jgi:hypothetical protein